MACHQFEDLILQHCEGASSPADRMRLEAHLSGCRDCRLFLQMQRELDRALASALPKPELSADFALRLRQRIVSQVVPRRFVSVFQALDYAGYGVLAVAGGYLLIDASNASAYIPRVAVAGALWFTIWSGQARVLWGIAGRALRISLAGPSSLRGDR